MHHHFFYKKYYIYFFIGVLLLSCSKIIAQDGACHKYFQRFFHSGKEDTLHAIIGLADKSVLIAGQTLTANDGLDGLIAKHDEAGTLIWSRALGLSKNDRILDIIENGVDGFYVLGSSNSFSTFPVPFVAKLNSSGQVIWCKAIQLPTREEIKAQNLLISPLSGIVITCNTAGAGYCVFLSSEGSLQKQYQFSSSSRIQVTASSINNGRIAVGYSVDSANTLNAQLAVINLQTDEATFQRAFTGSKDFTHSIVALEESGDSIRVAVLGKQVNPPLFDVKHYLQYLTLDLTGKTRFSARYFPTTQPAREIVSAVVRFLPENQLTYLYRDNSFAGYTKLVWVGSRGIPERVKNLFSDSDGTRALTFSLSGKNLLVGGRYLNLFTTNFLPAYFVASVSSNLEYGICSASPANELWDTVSLAHIRPAETFFGSINVFKDSGLILSNKLISLSSNTLCEKTICDTIQQNTSSCKTTFFSHYAAQTSIKVRSSTNTKDGGAIMSFLYQTIKTSAGLMKTDASGNVVWSLLLDTVLIPKGLNTGYATEITKIRESKSGNIWITGVGNFNTQRGVEQRVFYIQISLSGSVLWSMLLQGLSFLRPVDFIESDTGKVVALLEYPSSPHVASVLIYFDTTGNIIWKKQFRANNTLKSSPQYICLAIDDEKYLYAGGRIFIPGTVDAQNPVIITKINIATGNLVWSKQFNNNTGRALWLYKLQVLRDTIVCFTNEVPPINPFLNPLTPGNLRLSKNGVLLGANKYTDLKVNNISNLFSNNSLDNIDATITKDGYIYAYKDHTNQSMYLYKTNTKGKILWGVRYNNLFQYSTNTIAELDNNLFLSGSRGVLGVLYYQPFLLKIDNKGIIQSGASGLCSVTSVPATTDTLLLTSIDNVLNAEDTVVAEPQNLISFRPSLHSVQLSNIPYCFTTDICNQLNIVGPDTVCIGTLNKFALNKNTGCDATIVWDNKFAELGNTQINGDSIQLVPSKLGKYLLSSTVYTGCGAISLQKTIFIAPSASLLHIGNDTTLCSNDSIILNAGDDFKNYLWNTTASSKKITVKSAGNYRVSVKDYCGQTTEKTIRIQYADTISLNIGNDRNICKDDSVLIEGPQGFSRYTWFGNGIDSSFSQSFSVIVKKSTTVYIEAVSASGCKGKDSIRINILSLPIINLGRDTVICSGDSLKLDAGRENLIYQWSLPSTNKTVFVKNTGQYSLEVTDQNGCKFRDTIVIRVSEKSDFSLGKDTSICESESLLLKAPDNYQFRWQDGSFNKLFLIKQAGTYWIELNNNGCVNRDTILVTMKVTPLKEVFNDSTVCDKNELTIKLSNSSLGLSYLWQDGSTSARYSITKSGNYILKSNLENCVRIDTIKILFSKSPVKKPIREINKCNSDVVLVDVRQPDCNYMWQDNSRFPLYRFAYPGNYYCIIQNNCGFVVDSFTVRNISCECKPQIPNAFSPNGDGINDFFIPKLNCTPTFYEILIYNRYNQQVFRSQNITTHWNGQYNNKQVPIGVYYYQLKLKGKEEKEQSIYSGSITLLR